MKLPFEIDLSGKVAVVTGGSGVLGSYFCRALAACGANVAVLGRSKEKSGKLADELNGKGAGFAVDVVDVESLKTAKEDILKLWGRIDILINCAGGNNPVATTDDEQYSKEAKDLQDFFHLDPKGVQQVFDLNFLGTLLPTQVFGEELLKQEDGCIVNMSSMGAYLPLTKVGTYSAAKAAVTNFTQWLATYFAKAGVRVNAIAPGFFVTAQNKSLLFNEDGTPTARTGKILAATPMGRFGEPEELIGTLLYLVSKEASGFITGVVIPVDGGYTSYSGV
ncbi:MAG TPA: SDR family oxidoreductase [Christensenellaceae bacterium]|jgi:NAD(P)-dependent dehydrogenase (short-subunit alcohol dehydrogenase family)|nr:SDR family oxidoreductase [Christensenellaceae bacterium]